MTQISEKTREEAIKEVKAKKACFNCIHKKTCSYVENVIDFKMDRFVHSLLQVNVYDAINEAMGKNCFHFKNIHEEKK